MALYGYDEGNNKVEVYSKDQVASLLDQAIKGKTLGNANADLMVTSKKLVEQKAGTETKFWVGTSDEFASLNITGLDRYKVLINKASGEYVVYLVDDSETMAALETYLQHASELETFYKAQSKITNDQIDAITG